MQSDLAIDIGTSNTRILVQNKGIVTDEPSVIMVDMEEEKVISVGQQAYAMMGKTSAEKQVCRPMTSGVIADFGMAEVMIRTFLKQAVKSVVSMPKAVICVPGEITAVQKYAVADVVSEVGIKKIRMTEAPTAAAMGAGLDIDSPHGRLVVDIGGGTADMGVISVGGMAVSRCIDHAGDEMDEAIIRYIKNTYNMLIGRRTAEKAKIAVGSVISGTVPGTYPIKGKCLVTGMPIKADIDAEELVVPLQKTVQHIVLGIQDMLVETPPELLGDIYTDGILLTGGLAQLKGIGEFISKATELKVKIADDPSHCVIKGCGMALNSRKIIHNS